MNQGKRLLMAAVIVLAASLVSLTTGLGAAPAGRVESVKGQGQLMRGRLALPVTPGQALFEGDRLTAGRNSMVVMVLANHRISLEAGTSILISRADAAAKKFNLFLWLGRLWLTVQDKLAKMDFSVETPSAIAGVRGTAFAMEVSPDGTTWIAVTEGAVRVSRPDGSGAVQLSAGDETTVKPGEAPKKPKKIKQPKNGPSNNNGNGNKGNGGE